jgi:hypothetical protein
MKKLIIFASLIGLVVAGLTPAAAHVGTQMRGNTLQAGQSSRVYLSLGHGCTYREAKYGTSVFSVIVPKTAGKPTPEYVPGFKVVVAPSATVDPNGVPDSYTVTWTAKARSWIIEDGTFFDFGVKVKWDKTPQVIAFKTTQICYATTASGTKLPLYLNWQITDGSSKPAEPTIEWGPAPSVTTVP